MSKYDEQAQKFLDKYGISFSAKQGDVKCPLWCNGDCIHGDHYKVTFSRKSNHTRITMSFWNSWNDVREGKGVDAYDVLSGLQKTDPGTYEDFCSEYGYDTDSRKALKTYNAVTDEWLRNERFFTPEELEEMQEIQ